MLSLEVLIHLIFFFPVLCCRNRIWAFSFGCAGFYRCLYPSRSLLFNLYWWLASQLFFKVEWRNSYLLQCVGYSGEARSEKCRGSEEMFWLCPCVQMPLFNACGFHLVPADCCNCKIDPYVTSQWLPDSSQGVLVSGLQEKILPCLML